MTTTKWGNNKDANLYQLLNLVLQNVAGAHSSTVEGTLSANTVQHRPQYYNGTTSKLVAFTDDTAGSGVAVEEDGAEEGTGIDRFDFTSGLNLSVSGSQATVSTDETNLTNHINDTTDAHDATAISYAGATGLSATDVEAALDELDSEKATPAQITTAINNLIDAAPGTLDTLNELAAALGDDPNFATTVTTALAARVQTFAQTIGDGSATSFNIDHNFGTKDVICQAYIISSGAQYEPDFDRTTTNRVVVTTGTPALSTNTVRVLVQGVDA